MPPLKNLAGMVFGRLTVTNLHHTNKEAFWNCSCSCGNKKVVARSKLTSGDTKSCGCLHKELTSLASRKDLTGNVFGRLTVLEYHHTDRIAYWSCVCSCGNSVVVRGTSLRRGITSSCGCYKIESTKLKNSTHGLTSHPVYAVWTGMKQRCYNTNSVNYKHWGSRGIIVCDEWLDFLPFYEWAIANGYENGLSLDRIDNNGNYEPCNCRFATKKVQGNNTRRNIKFIYNGEPCTLSNLVKTKSARYLKVWKRIRLRGWPAERAINTP